VTEDELLIKVTAAAGERGVLWHHCTDSRKCQGHCGIPDLVLLGRKLLLAELKGEDGDTSADQDEWLWRLHESGMPYAVWSPSHWRSGVIQAALDELRMQ